MGHVVSFASGQIRIDLNLDDPRLAEAFRRKYQLFLCEGEGGFPVHVRWEAGEAYFAQNSVELNYSPEAASIIAPGYEGITRLGHGASLELRAANPVEGVEYFLRMVTAMLAFQAGGLLIHGAGIFHQGKGYIFFGRSGSGKTTVSRYSQQDLVLNDDFLVLRPEGVAWWADATPFTNPTQVPPSNQAMPLHGFFKLVQDKTVFLTQMTAAQAAGELMTGLPFVSGDADRLPRVMQRSAQIASTVPIYWLHFKNDNSFWAVIDKQIGYN